MKITLAFSREQRRKCRVFLCLVVCLTFFVLVYQQLTSTSHVKDDDARYTYSARDMEFILPRSYIPSEKNSVFILGAVAKNSTSLAEWDVFSIYGQWYSHHTVRESRLRCCFWFSNGTISETRVHNYYADGYMNNMYGANLVMWHITCVNKDENSIPHKISIARQYQCDSTNVAYIRPYLAYRQAADHLVITTKLAYETIDPEYVISFVETTKHFGVDKVIVYVHDSLDWKVKKILLHYAEFGNVEYHSITMADNHPFSFDDLDQYMNDEWIVMIDALQRNIGSQYFGILGMDEYLIPSGNNSWKQMLKNLSENFSKASHFFFKNNHYLTDKFTKNYACGKGCSLFEKYVTMVPDLYNRRDEKMILIPSRVIPYTINNHYVASRRPYTRATCPESEAYIRHYGKCDRKFSGRMCSKWHHPPYIEDTSMAEWSAKTIRRNVESVDNVISRQSRLAIVPP